MVEYGVFDRKHQSGVEDLVLVMRLLQGAVFMVVRIERMSGFQSRLKFGLCLIFRFS